jgi:hypothetical protein
VSGQSSVPDLSVDGMYCTYDLTVFLIVEFQVVISGKKSSSEFDRFPVSLRKVLSAGPEWFSVDP